MASFPNAKTHFFNEDTTCAPPPGTYDPKLEFNIKGPIPKEKKFSDQEYSSQSLENLTNPSQPHLPFRTPQLKRKKIILVTPQWMKKLNENKFDTPGSASSTGSVDIDKLRKPSQRKRIITRGECDRLEQELNSLTDKHLAEVSGLKSQMLALQDTVLEGEKREAELKTILEEKSALIFERHNEVMKFKLNLDTVEKKIRAERKDHRKYIEQLSEDKEDLEGLIATKQSAIVEINDKCLRLEQELKLVMLENVQLKKEIKLVDQQHSQLLNKLIQSEEKLQQLDDSLKSKVSELERGYDSAQQEAQAEFQTKFNYIVSHELTLKSQELENKLECANSNIDKIRVLIDKHIKEFFEYIKSLEEKLSFTFKELCAVEEQKNDLVLANLKQKVNFEETKDNCEYFGSEIKVYQEKFKQYETTITCIETEKKVLKMQLEEEKDYIDKLQKVFEEKNARINILTDHVNIESAKYKDSVTETDKMFETLKEQNKVFALNADNGIKLQEAEEKISKLEEELRTAQRQNYKSKIVEQQPLQEQLEEAQLRLHAVTEDRDRLNREVSDLMGHHNIRQKIKHINQLKKKNAELQEQKLQLQIENARQNKKLLEFKENLSETENTSRKQALTHIPKHGSFVMKDRNVPSYNIKGESTTQKLSRSPALLKGNKK